MKTRLFFLSLLPIASYCDEPTHSQYYDMIVKYENVRSIPYKDSLGNWEVAIGHHLTYANKGLNYLGEPVRTSEYSTREIVNLFNLDLEVAIKGAKSLFPSFGNQPVAVQLVLADLVFNMGKGKVAQFVKLRAAISANNYLLAAKEIENSLYFRQTGKRAAAHVATLKALGARP